MSVVFKAPASVSPLQSFTLPLTNNSFTTDAQNFVTATQALDVLVLTLMGFEPALGGRNNLTATRDPNNTDDSTLDYGALSFWINQSATNNSGSAPRAWICASAAPSAAVWFQISIGSSTGGNAEFSNLILDALLTGSCGQVSAFSGGGQGGATQITTIVANITTASSSSPAYDSAKLPAATAGRFVFGINSASNPFQMFGLGSDTINAYGSSVGFTQPVGSLVLYVCRDAGKWSAVNIDKGFTVPFVHNSNSATSGTTLTAANISGAISEVTLEMTGTMGGDANAQLPTVANLVAAIPNPVAGWSYKLRILNTSSANHVWTVTTNTGWTLNGTMTINQDASRAFYVTFTTLSAAVLQSIDA